MAIMYKKNLDKLSILTNDNIEITLRTFFCTLAISIC